MEVGSALAGQQQSQPAFVDPAPPCHNMTPDCIESPAVQSQKHSFITSSLLSSIPPDSNILNPYNTTPSDPQDIPTFP
ncbi:hypothetical protein BDZ94DRAFT_1242682 [Collybia nuda]|uniref:Uncharacterized protein n=1 Tax=Collybia nuda TaxID=64659 RepID=A0A9P6CRF5_9AGAR|nr:hypothetical protein BDZ94DRAFT_1242682 [Collybia nuda]